MQHCGSWPICVTSTWSQSLLVVRYRMSWPTCSSSRSSRVFFLSSWHLSNALWMVLKSIGTIKECLGLVDQQAYCVRLHLGSIEH